MALEDVRDTEVTEVTQAQEDEKKIVKRVGVFRFMLRGLLWPFSFVVRASRGLWMVLGFRRPADTVLGEPQHVSSPGRQSLTGRKRLHRVTRVLLVLLPRWLQSALGYPVSSSIGRCLSPEVRVSPTKPCGKGSKRKQDELDEDSTDEEHPTWVETLNQECAADDEDEEQDPDYEPRLQVKSIVHKMTLKKTFQSNNCRRS
uniref:Uncharacterized protein n=1 Tax=Knipowitschia caucasica TaxID=637954 RepID=A0AAV2KXV0_KNICA